MPWQTSHVALAQHNMLTRAGSQDRINSLNCCMSAECDSAAVSECWWCGARLWCVLYVTLQQVSLKTCCTAEKQPTSFWSYMLTQ